MVRNWIFIFAIYSYFTGWVYAYYLFSHFGLSLNAVEIPAYYFFMYAYFALPPFSVVNVGLGVVIGAVAVVLLYLGGRQWFQWLTGVVLLGLFPILFYVARGEAEREATRMRVDQPHPVTFVLKKEVTALFPKELIKVNQEGRLRMLTETKDRFYVLYQPRGEEAEIPYAYAYGIAKSDIALAKIGVQNVRRLDK